ncbi:MAG TPA: sulfotransferase domain-containing protein [Anaerolineales bacterium]
MTGRIVLSVGMPRAGSGWYYNLTHDLLLAAGFSDARLIRQRFRLQNILTEVNLNIGALTARRLLLVAVPAVLGHTFAIKAHAGPTSLAGYSFRLGLIQPTYIYRDPRDALLSTYEYGQRARQDNRDNAFARLTTVEQAVDFMKEYVSISEAWLECPAALHVRYENLLKNYEEEVDRLLSFLKLDASQPAVRCVIDNYHPDRSRSGQKGLHLAKGKIGRFREAFTAGQKQQFIHEFGDYLERMHYPL